MNRELLHTPLRISKKSAVFGAALAAFSLHTEADAAQNRPPVRSVSVGAQRDYTLRFVLNQKIPSSETTARLELSKLTLGEQKLLLRLLKDTPLGSSVSSTQAFDAFFPNPFGHFMNRFTQAERDALSHKADVLPEVKVILGNYYLNLVRATKRILETP